MDDLSKIPRGLWVGVGGGEVSNTKILKRKYSMKDGGLEGGGEVNPINLPGGGSINTLYISTFGSFHKCYHNKIHVRMCMLFSVPLLI